MQARLLINSLALVLIYMLSVAYEQKPAVVALLIANVAANIAVSLTVRFIDRGYLSVLSLAVAYLFVQWVSVEAISQITGSPQTQVATQSSWGWLLVAATATKELLTLPAPISTNLQSLVVGLLVVYWPVALGLYYAQQNKYVKSTVVMSLGFLTAMSLGLFSKQSVSTQTYDSDLLLAAQATCVAVLLVALARVGRYSTFAKVSPKPYSIREAAASLLLPISIFIIGALVAVIIAPTLVAAHPRTTLRALNQPPNQMLLKQSPLAALRTYFEPTQTNEVLFEFEATTPKKPSAKDDETPVTRVVLATMNAYDGSQMLVGQPLYKYAEPLFGGGSKSLKVTLRTQNIDYLPLIHGSERVLFLTPERDKLADKLYINTQAGTAVLDGDDLSGLTLEYDLTGGNRQAIEAQNFTAIDEKSEANDLFLPVELITWVEQQGVSADARGLLELIKRMRAHGHLSHTLTPATSAESELSGSVGSAEQQFVPNRAGHSVWRMAQIFGDFLDIEAATALGATPQVVVADEEQFATAAFLISRYLGFEARVVLGFVLQQAETPGQGKVPVCKNGRCLKRDVTAWLEIQDAGTKEWAVVDVTPLNTNYFSDAAETYTESRIYTEVSRQRLKGANSSDKQSIQEAGVKGQAATLEQEETRGRTNAESVGLKGSYQATEKLLLVTGFLLLPSVCAVLYLALVGGIKFLRGRYRFHTGDAKLKIYRGWLEYLDQLKDLGICVASNKTRLETSDALFSEVESAYSLQASTLAALADEASFGASASSAQAAAEFWQLLRVEVKTLYKTKNIWQRAMAVGSLRGIADSVYGFLAKTVISRSGK